MQPTAAREKILRALAPTPEDERALEYSWDFWARPKQQAPVGTWVVWLVLAGRGFGKTRTGAEWICQRVRQGARHIVLAGATAADVRDVMVEGESGILACYPEAPKGLRPKYEPSKRRITWPNGAVALCRSADEPDRFRGPQCDTAWGDEVAAWRYPEAWDQMMFGLRLGAAYGVAPRVCATTTPRPTKLIKSLIERAKKDATDVRVTRGSTYENKKNLANEFFRQIVRKYEGTRLGRQELDAALLEDVEGALWNRTRIDDLRVWPKDLPAMRAIVVAVDPQIADPSEQREKRRDKGGDDEDDELSETGIVVCGLGTDEHGYVIDDLSGPYTPGEWAEKVIWAVDMYDADRVVAEVNQGGEMVVANLRTLRRSEALKIRKVHAAREKRTRAEPVAALYEQGRVHHVGCLAKLEDQQCTWEPDKSRRSPDRLDATVWGLTDLMVKHDPRAGRGSPKGIVHTRRLEASPM